jgi:hypothetical protein
VNHIPYNEIPLVSGPPLARHGILRNRFNCNLEIWVQGKFYGAMSAFYYETCPDQRRVLQELAEMLRPLWEGTPWQRVLVKQLFMPWVGNGKVD